MMFCNYILDKLSFYSGKPIRRFPLILLLVVLLNLFFFSFLDSASAATGIINTNYVNIRSGPATTYDPVGQLEQGSKVEITDNKNNWYQIKYNQLTGWVRNDLIDLQKEYTLIVTGNSVNLRSGPGTTYEPVGYAQKGQTLTLLDVKSDWYHVRTSDGLAAYINASLAEKKEDNISPPAESINKPEPPAAVSQAEVISGTVYLRSGPDSSYDKVGTVSAGDILAILGQEKDWYKVKQADGSTAYIAGWLVRPVDNFPPAEPTNPSNPVGNTSTSPKVLLDGRELTFDVAPVIENDRILVPLRAIFEAMGASVNWDSKTGRVTSVKGNTTVVLTFESAKATVNGEVRNLDVPAKIKDNRTLAPLRFVGEAFGGQVDWNNTTRTVTIKSPTSSESKASSVIIRGTTNLRSGPSTNEESLDQAQEGERLPILAQRDGWYQVSRGGRTAWVAGWVVDLAWEQNEPLPPEDPVKNPPEKEEPNLPTNPEKPGRKALWLSVKNDASGIRINMESGAALDFDIDEERNKVTYEFEDRQIEGLSLVKQSLGSGEVVAQAHNDGSNTIVEIEFPSYIEYETSSEAGGKREVFIIPNAIYDVEPQMAGSIGDRLIIATLTPTEFTSSVKGDILEIILPGVAQGKARDEYEFKKESKLIEEVTFEEIKGANGGTLVRITTDDLGDYTVGQAANGLNILLVGEDQIRNRHDNLVVLDPGHGGSDTGARGSTLDEKDTNLKIALEVGKLLEEKGIDVEYTRTDDTYVELEERAAIANLINAGFFVSIHNNSVVDSSKQGTETYYYAPVTNDLLFLQLNERRSLAENLQEQLVKKIKRPDRGVKTANFSVLRNTTMPSALVETVFISNPEEERLLQQDDFIKRAAEAIAEGIAETMGK